MIGREVKYDRYRRVVLKYLFPPIKVNVVAVFSDTAKERREDVT
jgi:hypothetical protein